MKFALVNGALSSKISALNVPMLVSNIACLFILHPHNIFFSFEFNNIILMQFLLVSRLNISIHTDCSWPYDVLCLATGSRDTMLLTNALSSIYSSMILVKCWDLNIYMSLICENHCWPRLTLFMIPFHDFLNIIWAKIKSSYWSKPLFIICMTPVFWFLSARSSLP